MSPPPAKRSIKDNIGRYIIIIIKYNELKVKTDITLVACIMYYIIIYYVFHHRQVKM